MSIGISLDCYQGLALHEQIELMKKNGFTATFGMTEDREIAYKIEEVQKAGLYFDSLHGPMENMDDLWEDSPRGEEALVRILEGIELCARYSVPVLAVHLSSKSPVPHVTDIGCRRIDYLLLKAKERGVQLAFENLKYVGDVLYILETREEARFCWDMGHEHCFTPGMSLLPRFKERLAAIHLHDNGGEQGKDLHLIPFDGNIDFTHTARLLAASSYDGSIMLELTRRNSNVYDDMTAEEYYRRAGEAARKLEAMVECCR